MKNTDNTVSLKKARKKRKNESNGVKKENHKKLNKLNWVIKTQSVILNRKTKSGYMTFTKNMLQTKDSYFMLKDEKKMRYQVNINQAWKNGVSAEKHYERQRYSLPITRVIFEKDTTILMLLTPKNTVAKYMKPRQQTHRVKLTNQQSQWEVSAPL